VKKFNVFKCGMFSSGAGGFSCNKQALYVGQIIIIQLEFFSTVKVLNFWSSETCIWKVDPDPDPDPDSVSGSRFIKILDLDPDSPKSLDPDSPKSLDPDSKRWFHLKRDNCEWGTKFPTN
jgi:hypothetical protein